MKPRKEMIRMGTKIGAVLGGLVFLAFGLMPAFYFGSYGALMLLTHLTGGPVEPTVLVRMGLAFGIILGIACTALVSIITGSILGTALGYFVEALSAPAEVKEEIKEGAKAH